MAGPGFTQTFGGSVLYPAQSTYSTIALTQDITLLWPTELSIAGSPVVADIMDVAASAPGLSIAFSDATQASTGYTALFNNIGANTFEVKDSTGATILTVASGEAWLTYLADNSTAAGTWRIFQMGAGTSTANAAALAGAGLKAIATTLNEFVTIKTENANYVSTVADRAEAIEWTGGIGTITLPNAGTVGTGWFIYVKNSGSGNLTVSPPSGLIDGVASVVYAPNNSSIIVCDGANYFTIGFGQTINSVFSFIQINLTGHASPYVLSGAELNRVSYQFTGVLTANMAIQVPATVQQYWVDNETTGAFTLSLQSPTPGTVTSVGQGQRNILYCDGINVVPAVTFAATGFANGAAVSPSIFFTASPHTGIFSPGADQIGFATASTLRFSVDATGHLVANTPDTSGAGTYTFVINGPAPTGTALQVTQGLQSATSPGILLTASGVGASAQMSIASQTAVVGTSDLSIFQLGTSNDATILQRAAANLNLGTKGLTRATLDTNGRLNLATPDLGMTLFINGFSPTAAVIGFNNASNVGATAPILTANKPGASTNISAWIPVQVAGNLCWIPAWAN